MPYLLGGNMSGTRIRGTFVAGLALCAWAGGAAPASAGQRPAPGYYQCYQTTRYVSPVNGEASYATSFRTAVTLRSAHRYTISLEGIAGRWAMSGSKILFHSGPFDDAANGVHVSGTYYPHGRAMPNSQLAPSTKYPIVLRGRASNPDTRPAASETADATFWYCKRR